MAQQNQRSQAPLYVRNKTGPSRVAPSEYLGSAWSALLSSPCEGQRDTETKYSSPDHCPPAIPLQWGPWHMSSPPDWHVTSHMSTQMRWNRPSPKSLLRLSPFCDSWPGQRGRSREGKWKAFPLFKHRNSLRKAPASFMSWVRTRIFKGSSREADISV